MHYFTLRVSLQTCNKFKFKSTNHAFATLLTRNFRQDDERLAMVLRATTMSEFKFADFAKKLRREILVKIPHSSILHYAFSSWIERKMKKIIN